MPEDHTPKTASYLFLERDGEILLMKRQNTGFKDGMYSLVAGHVDEGENFRQAMVREADEEVGVSIDPEDLEPVSVMHRDADGVAYVDLFFRVTRWEGEPTNEEPEKCGELIWVEKDDIPENTIGFVKEAIETVDEELDYREFGW